LCVCVRVCVTTASGALFSAFMLYAIGRDVDHRSDFVNW
jgi:hypothetical protein